MEKAQEKGSMYHQSKEDRIRTVLKYHFEKEGTICDCGGPTCNPAFENLVKDLVLCTESLPNSANA